MGLYMQEVNYKKASTYYLVGSLFNKGMAFLTVPIFTRILSTSDYGIVNTYNSWIAIVSMLIGFALHMSIRIAFVDYREQINEFMSVTTTFVIGVGFLISGFVLIGMSLIEGSVGVTLVVLCLLQGMATALLENYSMYLMMQYRYKFRTIIMILPNLVSVIISTLAILFIVKTNLYMGRIVPTAVVHMFFGILIAVLIYRKSKLLYKREYLKYGLMISTPLILHGIALNILSQLDRTMITWLASASQTGIYSLIYNFSMIAMVITTAIDGVWVPWFMGKYKERKIEEINKLSVDYTKVITYAMVGLILVGPEIVRILASEKYWEGIVIIPPVVLANYMIFLYMFYVNVEHFHKKTVYITINTLIAAGVNVLLNYIFIPRYGYIAAAYTTLAAYAIAFILHAKYAKKLEKKLYPISMFGPSLIHIVVATTLFYMLIDFGVLRWSIAIIYICVMFYINLTKIKQFFPALERFPFFRK